MSAAPPSLYRPFSEPPARLALRGSVSSEGRAHDFDVVSRGDFVPGRIDRPAAGTDHAVVLVVGHAELRPQAVARDLAIARIDLPLLGARRSPKLSDRLVAGHAELTGDRPLDPDTRALVEEFARQSVSDIVRTLEGLAAEPGLDGGRLALVGAGLGASAAAWALPFVPALRACVLAGPLPGRTDAGLDAVAPIAHAALGDLRCRLLAGPADAAAAALSASLPGRPAVEALTPTEAGSALVSASVPAPADAIVDFVAEALGR
ncbi:MAG: hypothetical protein AAGC67_21510 [Myxococcota bacterium]